jgi:carboxyl-terminal processing protease
MADEPHSPHPAPVIAIARGGCYNHATSDGRTKTSFRLGPPLAWLFFMTQTIRSTFLVILVVLMAGAAFAAGYLARDFLAGRQVAGAADGFALLDEAWSYVDASYLGDRPDQRLVTYGAIRGALNELGDPYTVFVEPVAREHERDSLRGNYGGIGANLSRNEDGELLLDPIPGNPAEAAGIERGDVLLAVDGREITPEMTVSDIAQLVRGEKGTTVVLTVRHPESSEPVDIAVVRGDILIPSVTYRLLDEAPAIGYIQLSRFSGESGKEIETAITALQAQGAAALILDLRHNGGGLLDAAIEVAGHFLDGGPVMIQKSRTEEERTYDASQGAVAGAMPVIVLIDGETASSSEILAGALQDRGRARLVGSRTFGKGSVQLVYDLSDGSSVHVTSSRWYTPNRHEIDEQGLQPDIPVEVTQEAIDRGQDVVLETAVAHLNGND